MVGVHTLRNSLIPVITFIGVDFGSLMGGAIVTERIFNINGVGNFLYRSIRQQDGQAVVGAVVVLILIFLLRQPDRRHPVRLPGSEDLAMTDTTRNSALGVEGAIAGEVPGGGNVRWQSRADRSWQRRLGRTPAQPDVLDLVRPDRALRADGRVPAAVHRQDPYFADLGKARQPPSSDAWFG